MTSTSMYTIIQTQKGYKAILFRQNLYRQQKVNQSGSVRWVCTNRKCSSSITIYNEKIKAIRGFHNHTNIDRSPSIIKAVQNIREKVTQNLTKPITQIYNETVANYRQTKGSAGSVPMFDMLKSTLYRDRSTVLPKLPTKLVDIMLPVDFTKNLYNEQMCFSNQTQPSCIFAFCSLSALQQLAQCSIWNADGTFRTAPKLFGQSYTIHGHNQFSMKPLVFGALENKYEHTYTLFLQSLVKYAGENNVILAPKSILIDFELSSYNAFKTIFPEAKILFCHFHFAKNIMKHIKKLHLSHELKTHDVKSQIANIISLPLLPPNEITNAFQNSENILVSINNNFQPFLTYVKKTYICNAKFKSDNWNHYETLFERPRTNNHRLISKPNFWKWLLHIQKVDEESIIRPEQEHQQQRTTRRRKKQNILRDLCLNQLKKEYEKNLIDINEYQRRIRHISYLYIDTLDNTVDSDDSE